MYPIWAGGGGVATKKNTIETAVHRDDERMKCAARKKRPGLREVVVRPFLPDELDGELDFARPTIARDGTETRSRRRAKSRTLGDKRDRATRAAD